MSPMKARWTLKETDFLSKNIHESIDYLLEGLPKRSKYSILRKKLELYSPECIESNKNLIINDYHDNKMGLKTVSKKYNVNPSCLLRKLNDWGIKVRTRGERKDLNGSNNLNWTGFGDIPGGMFSNIKRDALRRGIDFSITIEYAWELFLSQNKTCVLSGELLVINSNRKLCTASLDRINYLDGYTESNVQWVHKNINIMKNRFSDEEYLYWCKKVVDYRLQSSACCL